MKPAQRGMLVGLVVALPGGIVLGARYGAFGAILGGVLSLVVVFALVPVAIGLLMLLCRLAGMNPRDIEERIALLATWGVAVAATLVTVASILALR